MGHGSPASIFLSHLSLSSALMSLFLPTWKPDQYLSIIGTKKLGPWIPCPLPLTSLYSSLISIFLRTWKTYPSLSLSNWSIDLGGMYPECQQAMKLGAWIRRTYGGYNNKFCFASTSCFSSHTVLLWISSFFAGLQLNRPYFFRFVLHIFQLLVCWFSRYMPIIFQFFSSIQDCCTM